MIDEKKLIEAFRASMDTGRESFPIDLIIECIEDQPKVDEWIPVSERLPKQDEESEYYNSVIVTLDNDRVSEGCYRDKEKEWWADAPDGEHYSENVTGHVIAWMPLPEPYRPEAHETKKQTNADRIRNMTDEELSSFLNDTVFEDGQNMFLCEDYVGTSACDGCQCGDCKAYLHWLRKEVEE